MAKPWYVIKFKYINEPWYEWARTQVPEIVDHYVSGCRYEHPGAEVQPFKELK